MTRARWFRGAALALVVPRLAAAAVLLNEIEVNPPTAADDPWEYIEIRGPEGASLAGYQVFVVDGDGGGEGFADQVVDLGTACNGDTCTLGSNGLAIVKAPSGGHTTPPATTVIGDPQLGVFGGGIENGTLSVLLVAGPAPLTEGNDYDTNDDGTLELPPADTIVDAVAWTDGDAGDLVYGGVSLVGGGSPPDAATRFAGDDTPLAASAWYHGDLSGNASTTSYDPGAVSADFPSGGRLTPGAANEPPPLATTTTLATPTTTLPPPVPVAVRVAVVKPSRLFRFVARGTFPLPDPSIDDPRNEGGTLAFVGTTGGATYTLARSGWRGIGPKKDGSRGFRFAGYPCRVVVIKPTALKGVCRNDTGTVGLPEPGPLGIVLRIGDGTRYCGACGGVAKGNASVLFKRTACAAPATCP
jgi:hypothetical protein